MKKTFNYNKFNVAIADEIVDSIYTLTQKFCEGKQNTPEYQELNASVTEKFMKYCAESIPGYTYNGLEDVKNPMVHKNMFFTQTFDTIMAQAITPAIPTVLVEGYDTFMEVTQVSWGDNAKYTVASNEMFIVNELAEGVARGGLQTSLNTEYTVQASPKQVATYVDWYHVVTGKQDWGYIVAKTAYSFAMYVQAKAVKAMASVIAPAGSAEWGISGYQTNGLTDMNWMTLARNVSLANGSASVYALGTGIALTNVLPSESPVSQFRYGEDSDIIRRGWLPSYKGVPLIELKNALMPNTVNGVPEVVLPDDVIFFLPMGLNKPVKVVVEGNSVTIEKDPLYQPDHCYAWVCTAHIGVDTICGTKFGSLLLN